MNTLLKYGLPSLLALAMATPAMAQNGGYNNQMGQSDSGQNYSQNGNYRQNGWNNGSGYSRNGSYGNQQNYGQNGNNQQNYGQNERYGRNGPNGWNNGQSGNSDENGQTYGQNGNNGRQYGQNGSYGQNFPPNSGNEEAVTRDFMAHVQHRLREEGFYNHGHIDGLWGPATQDALQDFQQQHNLRVTGQIDMHTLAALHMMRGRAYGMNGGYQTYNRGSDQGQNYSSNNTGSHRSNGYGEHMGDNGATGQMNR